MTQSMTQAQLKSYAQLCERAAQDAHNLVLVETQHPIEEALKAGLKPEVIFALPGKTFAFDTIPLDERAMKKLATTDSLPPCVGIFKKPKADLADLLEMPQPMILILAGLQDAGNVGTLIRSAVAFGATGIILTQDSVNPYHPKVIRASAGLVFHQPVITLQHGLPEVFTKLPTLEILLTSNRGSQLKAYYEMDYTRPLALVLGSEGPGLSHELVESGSYPSVQIPLQSGVDSLNVAVSGSIILAEAHRQRRAAHLC